MVPVQFSSPHSVAEIWFTNRFSAYFVGFCLGFLEKEEKAKHRVYSIFFSPDPWDLLSSVLRDRPQHKELNSFSLSPYIYIYIYIYAAIFPSSLRAFEPSTNQGG